MKFVILGKNYYFLFIILRKGFHIYINKFSTQLNVIFIDKIFKIKTNFYQHQNKVPTDLITKTLRIKVLN